MSEVDALGAFLNFAGKFQLMTAVEEQEAAKLIEEGHCASAILDAEPNHPKRAEYRRILIHGEKARVRFINSNLRLVVMLARRYSTGELELIDVIQLGNIGLIKAVDKFDWRRGYRFSTHATWWIRQSIGVGTEQTAGLIRMPRSAREEQNLIWAATKNIGTNYSNQTIHEVSDWTGLRSDRIKLVLNYPREVSSLDAPGDFRHPLQDRISNPLLDSLEEEVEHHLVRRAVQEGLMSVSFRDREILSRRFGLFGFQPHSIKEISAALEMTVAAASKALSSALDGIRSYLVPTFSEQ